MALDHNLLYQLFSDPEFFREVPAFHFMKDHALAVVARFAKGATDKRPGDCATCGSLRQHVAPLRLMFVAEARKLAADVPRAMEPLAEFVARRRGYRPRPLLIYFRDGGKVRSLEL